MQERNITFGWGLLVIADSASNRQVPDFLSNTQQVSSTIDAIVMKVRHGQDGVVRVRLDPPSTALPVHVARLHVSVPSGRLVLSDVMQDVSIELALADGVYLVDLFADDSAQPSAVDVLVSEPDRA